MKVLFALSDDEVSEQIVKRYRKEFKEIISYKNVYYFNAIVKEIQKDKTYDRIVISEDLEQYASNNINQIDKVIFEKLDAITDEATDGKGKEIPIVFICANNRKKSDYFAVKLFSLGIYNALIGNDRDISEVCRLLKKPRSKKDAKLYYKIDSDEVNYQSESENDVNESEIQNILAHYKKIGNDEKKCIESFENIAEQYNEQQLKLIIKCLPLSVRAILEEKSDTYKAMVLESPSLKLSSAQITREKNKGKTSTTIQSLLGDQSEGIRKEVIIPTNINFKNLNKNNKEEDTKIKTIIPETKQNQTKKEEKIKEEPVFDFIIEEPAESEEKNEVNNKSENTNKDEIIHDFIIEEPVESEEVIDSTIDEDNNENEQDDDSIIDFTFDDEEETETEDEEEPVLDFTAEEEETEEQEEPVFDFTVEEEETETEDEEEPVLDFTVEEEETEEQEEPVLDFTAEEEETEEQEEPVFDFTVEEEETETEDEEEPVLDFTVEEEEVEEQEEPVLDFTVEEETETEDKEESVLDFTVEDEAEEKEDDLPDLEIEEILPDLEIEELQYEDEEKKSQVEEKEEEKKSKLIIEDNESKFMSFKEREQEQNLMQEDDSEEQQVDITGEQINNQSDITDEISEKDLDVLEETLDEVGMLLEEENYDEYENDDDKIHVEDFIIEDNLGIKKDAQDETENYKKHIQELFTDAEIYASGKKIVAFVGAHQAGTSFLVNSLAELLQSKGVNTAILDLTRNRNSYYIYTKNDEDLRNIAMNTTDNLLNNRNSGIKVRRNLFVYTALPEDKIEEKDIKLMLKNLISKHQLILIDCDLDTPINCFGYANEVYLVQNMDILTIQPLTEFLFKLKNANILNDTKFNVIVNKSIFVRGLWPKMIISGMSYYSDPKMSETIELFNRNEINRIIIPFDEKTYSKYLESMTDCDINISGYSKKFMKSLKEVALKICPQIKIK